MLLSEISLLSVLLGPHSAIFADRRPPPDPPPLLPWAVTPVIKVEMPNLSSSGRYTNRQAAMRYTPGSHTVQMMSSTPLYVGSENESLL